MMELLEFHIYSIISTIGSTLLYCKDQNLNAKRALKNAHLILPPFMKNSFVEVNNLTSLAVSSYLEFKRHKDKNSDAVFTEGELKDTIKYLRMVLSLTRKKFKPKAANVKLFLAKMLVITNEQNNEAKQLTGEALDYLQRNNLPIVELWNCESTFVLDPSFIQKLHRISENTISLIRPDLF